MNPLRSLLLLLVVAASVPTTLQAQSGQSRRTTWRVVLVGGEAFHGFLLHEDELEVQISDFQGNELIIEREQILRIERLKGTISAKIDDGREGGIGTQVSDPSSASEIAVPEVVGNLSAAERVEKGLDGLVVRMKADQSLPFRADEIAKGHWKWAERKRGRASTTKFVYEDARPARSRVRDIGALIYVLERIDKEPGLLWIPYRWDPRQRDWSLREYCPPALTAAQRLKDARRFLDKKGDELARAEARAKAVPPNIPAGRALRNEVEKARDSYQSALERYLGKANEAGVYLKNLAQGRSQTQPSQVTPLEKSRRRPSSGE